MYYYIIPSVPPWDLEYVQMLCLDTITIRKDNPSFSVIFFSKFSPLRVHSSSIEFVGRKNGQLSVLLPPIPIIGLVGWVKHLKLSGHTRNA